MSPMVSFFLFNFIVVAGALKFLVFVIITASLMDSVYRSFKDEDGYLYMYYSTEKTFGSCIN